MLRHDTGVNPSPTRYFDPRAASSWIQPPGLRVAAKGGRRQPNGATGAGRRCRRPARARGVGRRRRRRARRLHVDPRHDDRQRRAGDAGAQTAFAPARRTFRPARRSAMGAVERLQGFVERNLSGRAFANEVDFHAHLYLLNVGSSAAAAGALSSRREALRSLKRHVSRELYPPPDRHPLDYKKHRCLLRTRSHSSLPTRPARRSSSSGCGARPHGSSLPRVGAASSGRRGLLHAPRNRRYG